MIFDWFVGLLKGAVSYLAALFAGFKYGSLREKKKKSDRDLEAMIDAKNIRERYERDPAFAKRVRDKYTR